MAAIESRSNRENEEWLIAITSDHGGGGLNYKSHGNYEELDRKILLILSGDGIRAGYIGADCDTKVSHMDVYPSVFEYLRKPIEAAWDLDGISRLEWTLSST